ncbi:mucin-5AC-like [Pelodytes ibericus]
MPQYCQEVISEAMVSSIIFTWSPGVLKTNQNGVCSTWGNFHYKTFDGEIYHFPGSCNYLFAAHCGKHFEDFNLQIEQSVVDTLPTITQISMKVNGLLFELINHTPTLNGVQLKLPYNQNGIQIEKTDNELKISAKLVLTLVWHDDSSVLLTLNKKYMGETCGLCGDYDGNKKNDFVFNGASALLLNHPVVYMEEIAGNRKAFCLKLLRGSKWLRCNRIVNSDAYVKAFMQDMYLCKSSTKFSSFCLCNTITEYSRQCALSGGKPPEWRHEHMCYKTCPLNLIYKECSSPCAPTCSNPGRQYFCEGTCVAGCVCPNEYVKDDITGAGCIPLSNCSCIYNNAIYPPGSYYYAPCFQCLCSAGHWNCEELPCPSSCSVEGGSHITTFDKAHYTFHGKCTYILTKPCTGNAFVVTIEMKKCAYSETATCLTRVLLFLDKGKFIFEIKYDNSDFPMVTYDENKMAKAGITIFWPSSFFLIVHTNKGLYLQVQLTPIMQLFVILDPSYKKKTCGLCGNFNDIQRDDFRTSSGAIEGNVAEYANTWKTEYSCLNVINIPEHPCNYGMEIENYVSYCPKSFVFSYNVTTCIPTCRSLSEPDPACSFKFFTVDGCVCPKNTYLDERGVCVRKEECPCYYNGIPVLVEKPLLVANKICMCKNRIWVCESKPDMGICTVYGEGHYITFDSKRYTISGDCEYTLVQDYCHIDDLQKGSFRVITENIPCGTTGTSCTKSIIVYLGAHKLILTDGQLEVEEKSNGMERPYKVRHMGNFLVIETSNGIVLEWDKMTTIFIHLKVDFKGKVCGLCGNFDGNCNNDFTTRSQFVVEDVAEFRNSWRSSPDCPEVFISKDPCAVNTYRIPWAQKRCSMIKSEVFSACHSEVDPDKYYEACVSDTCACDMGGDCDCYCTAIAVYAQACSEACVCVDWRTPNICPLFCDFYNKEEACEWHYKPCGVPCMKTCRNPSGICLHHLKGLEGCYPVCPEGRPYFNEDEMQCVSQCGCLDNEDRYYHTGDTVESCNACESWYSSEMLVPHWNFDCQLQLLMQKLCSLLCTVAMKCTIPHTEHLRERHQIGNHIHTASKKKSRF